MIWLTVLPAVLGILAVALTCLCARTIVELARHWSGEVRDAARTSRTIVDSDALLAVAVPGRRGGVLVSRGLLRALDRAQLQVVFQHEASHLRHGHHRYLALGALAAGTVPLLRRLNLTPVIDRVTNVRIPAPLSGP